MPSPTSPDVQQPATFRPRPIHWKYLRFLLEALETDGNPSDRAIAKKLDCRHEAISRWRHWHPAFETWVSAEIRRCALRDVSKVLKRTSVLAMRGSAKHTELFLRATGEIGATDAGTPPAGPQIVNVINIPSRVTPAEWRGGTLEDAPPRILIEGK